MANPHLDGASFPKLTKTGTSTGTVTGTEIGGGNPVFIQTKNTKKQWQGSVTGLQSGTTWNASVQNTQWNDEKVDVPDTVTVTVSNTSGPSNTVDTQSDVSGS